MSGDCEKDLSPSRAAQEADETPGKEQEARVELMEQKWELKPELVQKLAESVAILGGLWTFLFVEPSLK